VNDGEIVVDAVLHSAPLPRVLRLDSSIRPYAWGSPTVIPAFLGRAPTGEPAAELWVGAHPDEPSRWAEHPLKPGLDALVAADPLALLGESVVARFGPRLPFLLKLLAADKCLSLQVHPNSQQAEAGFAAEEAAGVPPRAAERNYSDPHHKPELLCALTDFEALCGFRPVQDTVRYLQALIGRGAVDLATYVELIAAPDGLRAAFTTLLTLPASARAPLIAAVVAACELEVAASGPWSGPARASVLAAQDFPGDVGAVLALLLNYVRLAPGEAIYLGAGNVHAYLRGFGVEVLASSDNVLRCGLTPKHIDVPELLKVAVIEPLADPLSPEQVLSAQQRRYPVPVADFELSVLTPGGGAVELAADRPWLVIATKGEVSVWDGAASREVGLSQGEAVFVAVGSMPVAVRGLGAAHALSTGI
jgi:mannose-6-phosphate isomerase